MLAELILLLLSFTGVASDWPDQLDNTHMDVVLTLATIPESDWSAYKAIAHCESRFVRDVVAHTDREHSLGLWQTWIGWWSHAGEDPADYTDPVAAARVTRYVRDYLGRWGGPGGWSCAAKVGLR